MDINRVEIKCGTGNLKSMFIPQKLGFIKEGVIRQAAFVNDRFIDLALFSMLKTDWKIS
jgi:ribosomal-protein-serine acetyltransferase